MVKSVKTGDCGCSREFCGVETKKIWHQTEVTNISSCELHIPWEKCLASGKEFVHVKHNSREKLFEIQSSTIKIIDSQTKEWAESSLQTLLLSMVG